MRAASGQLQAVLAAGVGGLAQADLFTLTLVGGQTSYFTSYDTDLVYGGQLYHAAGPFVERSQWDVSNTMQVPTMDILVRATNVAWSGGQTIKRAAHDGALDGAMWTVTRVFMPTPGDTATLGGVLIFAGMSGQCDIDGYEIKVTCKGLTNLLDVYAPAHQYQANCVHTFCDVNCTLNRATFTTTNSYNSGGGGDGRLNIPLQTTITNFNQLVLGTLTVTSGAATGLARTIIGATSSAILLAYPLPEVMVPGDTFTLFQGCDKTFTTCDGTYANKAHFRGFRWIPEATKAA